MQKAKPALVHVPIRAAIGELWPTVVGAVGGTTVATYLLVELFFGYVEAKAILIGVICSFAGSVVIGHRNLRFWKTIGQDNARLEEQNRELDAYAHSVAHDLRNPLTAIVGFSSLLASGEVGPEEMTAVASDVHAAAMGMTDSVEALLALAGFRHDVDLQPVDVGGALDSAWKRVAPTDSQVEFKRADDWPTVQANPKWLEEAWVNYLGNAFKYGGRPLQITAGWEPVGDSYRCWVEDNGPGVTGDPSMLFKEFHRSDDRVEGHGLGLWIVSRIISRLGGTVGAENGTMGARFWFDLPAV